MTRDHMIRHVISYRRSIAIKPLPAAVFETSYSVPKHVKEHKK